MNRLRAGDFVEVRSKEEILSMLDKNGRLEELPFMPQMFQYCGQQFKVFKRAHKTCDTVNETGGRKLHNGVHLDLRCDGVAYGGCQAACLIFWKEAWLKPVNKLNSPNDSLLLVDSKGTSESLNSGCCTEEDVWNGTQLKSADIGEEIRYLCQATHLPVFTTLLPWWDVRQYFEDYSSGNATLYQVLSGVVYFCFYFLCNRVSKIWWKLSLLLRWFYDQFQKLWGGFPYPRKEGVIPAGQSTPTCSLNLQLGELVRVKSYDEILSTLDTNLKNRGLKFDAEMVPYCGGVYRVRTILNKFLEEKTGKLITLKHPSILLEDVCCQARYSDCRMLCPRRTYIWWREMWLERVSDSNNDKTVNV